MGPQEERGALRTVTPHRQNIIDLTFCSESSLLFSLLTVLLL